MDLENYKLVLSKLRINPRRKMPYYPLQPKREYYNFQRHYYIKYNKEKRKALTYNTKKVLAALHQKKDYKDQIIVPKEILEKGINFPLEQMFKKFDALLNEKIAVDFRLAQSGIETDFLPLENENKINLTSKAIFLNKYHLLNNFMTHDSLSIMLNYINPITKKWLFHNNNRKVENHELERHVDPEYIIKNQFSPYKLRNLKHEKEVFGVSYTPQDAVFYKFNFFYNQVNYDIEKKNLKFDFTNATLNHIYTKFFYLQKSVEKNKQFLKTHTKKRRILLKPFIAGFHCLNADVIGDFFIKKLRKHHLVKAIALQLKREMGRFRNVFKGLRLRLSGRFTRRQRAFYLQEMFKKNPLNNRNYTLTYAQVKLGLRYGAVSVKIWHSVEAKIFAGKFLTKNYLHTFYNNNNIEEQDNNKKEFSQNNEEDYEDENEDEEEKYLKLLI